MWVILLVTTRIPACRVENSDMARTASPFCRRDRTPCVSWRRRNPRQTRNFLPNPTKALSESCPGQPTGVTKGSPDFVMTANLSEAMRSSCPRHRDPPVPALPSAAPTRGHEGRPTAQRRWPARRHRSRRESVVHARPPFRRAGSGARRRAAVRTGARRAWPQGGRHRP